MKKVYNYITIVKDGDELKLGKNCGISCNRRNAMDKAHGRDRRIVAAVNLLSTDKEATTKCLKKIEELNATHKLGDKLMDLPLGVITCCIMIIAKQYGYAKECTEHLGIACYHSY